MNRETLLGAVLAGGLSRRLGRDKALLPVDPTDPESLNWAERSAAVLGPLCAEVVICGRDSAPSGRRAIPDRRLSAGPLSGVESALLFGGGRAALTLPCDLPRMTSALLARLTDDADPRAEVTAFRHADGLQEPLVALWMPRIAKSLTRFLDLEGRAAHYFLADRDVRWIEIPPETADQFENVNTPEELSRWLGSETTPPPGDTCAP